VDAAPAIFDLPANAAPARGRSRAARQRRHEGDAFTVRNRESWTHGALVHVPPVNGSTSLS
jgi:hypothetical protein